MIGIIVAMDIELENIIKEIKNLEKLTINKYSFYKGKINNKKVVLAKSGIGKVNAAIVTQILINFFNPSYIIHTGIAGSLDNNIKPLSIVLGEKIKYHDVRKEQLLNSMPYKEYFSSDEYLLKKTIEICNENNISFNVGCILTGDDFIDNTIKKNSILKKYSEGMCVEMEGASVCHSAYVCDVPIIVIRCISDLADDQLELDYNTFKYEASRISSTVVINLINKI